MWFQVGIIVLVVAFLMYLGTTFGASVASLVINGALIFIIVYRSYFEMQAGRVWQHVAGAIVALFLIFWLGSTGRPFWTITLFLIAAYVFALLFQLVPFRRKKLPRGRLTPKYH